MSRLRIVVMGIMGQNPFAGVVWQGLHYLEGLRRLGHAVYYVENAGGSAFDFDADAESGDPYFVWHVRRLMDWCATQDTRRSQPLGLCVYK
jgi:hypothetical protein